MKATRDAKASAMQPKQIHLSRLGDDTRTTNGQSR
jgi:hypothetical protein